ncbi:MAG: HAMP domain-containing histidine kinase [Actinomycetota bacterium]|jgi:signal transduction histidine kinase|nr:HAMP domain-containing histidine kinase [Actinomycetota bacterium]MDQ3423200.1 HAMP domain-containing histidine kinase [Actinomycetota bacterium]
MTDTVLVVLIAAAAAGTAGSIGWLLLRLRRMPSLRVALTTATVTAVLAVVAGAVATSRAMFLSRHDFVVVLWVCASAGVVAVTFGLLIARSIVADSHLVQRAARALADGTPIAGGRQPSTAELAEISRELRSAADRLAWARKRERELEASRRELVAWVSHDLRTPLAGLRAMAEALEDSVAADPARYHRQVRLQVDRLSGMVDDLFDLSRIHAGNLRLTMEEVSLSDLVSDVLAGTDSLAQARRVHLTGEAESPLALTADPRELTRVLTNLVVNAVRHTPAHGVVRVRVRPQGAMAVVSVDDECGGFPEQDLGKVFDVAWRGTDARTPGPDGGAGLGLAIVRGIVEAHHGTVTVSNAGAGCRFEVRLPTASV